MKWCWRLSAFVLAVIAAVPVLRSATAGPTVDKSQLEAYLRYAEGFMSNIHFVIDDPTASAYPGFYRVSVHLTADGGAKLDKTYFVTSDGKQIVAGPIWDLNKSPFIDTLSRLPAGGYSFGPADARVQIVLFSDFQCPFCKEYAKTIRDNIPQKYPRDVRVTFEDFPIDSIHPWARAAAEASHCVGAQNPDAFWAYHDWIFEHSGEIKPENLKEKVLAWAGEQKLDIGKLGACIVSHAMAGEVAKAEQAGKRLEVQSTPTAFVNGRMIPGAIPWALPNSPGTGLNSVIQLELKRPDSVTGTLAKP
jgi:protein-disulfide isomerase